MIIKATVRGNGAQLTRYLLNSSKNERTELLEMRGFVVDNLQTALAVEEAIADGQTHCEKPFYHVAFRAAAGEALTNEQWKHCADELEKAVGLEGHHRAAVMHEQNGERHMHVVWSRIDPETLDVAQLSFDHRKCQQVARELEIELDLKRVPSHAPNRKLDAPTFNEAEQARRKGQDLKATREAIREAWEESHDGRGFAEALKKRGFVLAQGDRRDFVAVDEQGSVYSIGKRTTGATAAEVRKQLADIERERVPTVEEAQEQQQQQQQQRERQRREDTRETAQEARREAARGAEKARDSRAAAPEPQPTQGRGEEKLKTDRLVGGLIGTAGKALEGVADFFVGGTPKTPQELKQERQDSADRAQIRQEERKKEQAAQPEQRPKTLEEALALARQRAAEARTQRMDDDTRRKLEEEERRRNWWDRGHERER